jgi:hypothetical protein
MITMSMYTDDEITRARDILTDGMGWTGGDGPYTDVLDLLERVLRAGDQGPVPSLAHALEATEGAKLAEVKEWWSGW